MLLSVFGQPGYYATYMYVPSYPQRCVWWTLRHSACRMRSGPQTSTVVEVWRLLCSTSQATIRNHSVHTGMTTSTHPTQHALTAIGSLRRYSMSAISRLSPQFTFSLHFPAQHANLPHPVTGHTPTSQDHEIIGHQRGMPLVFLCYTPPCKNFRVHAR